MKYIKHMSGIKFILKSSLFAEHTTGYVLIKYY
jgi:hypothetical protein